MIKRILQNFYTPIYIEPGTFSCKLAYNIKNELKHKTIEYHPSKLFMNNGVIVDYENAKDFFSKNISKIDEFGTIKSLLGFSANVLIHSKITDVELSALEDALKESNCRVVNFYAEPISNINVKENTNAISINVGYSTTEMIYYKNSEIEHIVSEELGSEDLISSIAKFIEEKYNAKVSQSQMVELIQTLDFKSKKNISLFVKDVLRNKSITLEVRANELYPIVKIYLEELAKIILHFIEQINIDEIREQKKSGLLLSGGIFQNFNYLSYISTQTEFDLIFIDPQEQLQNLVEISKLEELKFSKEII